MKNIHVSLISALLFSLMLFVGACTEEFEEFEVSDGFSYFPVDSGHWVIYQVDSINYSTFLEGGVDTISAEVMELLSTPFIDNEGRSAITMERRIRHSDTVAWENIIPTIWYVVRDSSRAERVEGELRFMNLVFPIVEGISWSGNAYINTSSSTTNQFQDWNYTYTQVNTPASFGGFNFNETCTILQNDYEDLVNKVYSIETYAKEVGLVYKEQWILELGGNDITDPTPWPNRAERGHVVTIEVIDYAQ